MRSTLEPQPFHDQEKAPLSRRYGLGRDERDVLSLGLLIVTLVRRDRSRL